MSTFGFECVKERKTFVLQGPNQKKKKGIILTRITFEWEKKKEKKKERKY